MSNDNASNLDNEISKEELNESNVDDDDGDDCEYEASEASLDDEETMEEDEKLELEENSDLINDLVEDSQVPVEELRRRYGMSALPVALPSSNTTESAEDNNTQVTRTRSGRIIRPVVNTQKDKNINKPILEEKSSPPQDTVIVTNEKTSNKSDNSISVQPKQECSNKAKNETASLSTMDEEITSVDAAVDEESKLTTDGLSYLLKGENGSDYNSEDDRDYEPSHFIDMPWKNEIRQGCEYQAIVNDAPMPCRSNYEESCGESTLLWPAFSSNACPLPVADVDSYLMRYYCLSAGLPSELAAAGDKENSIGSQPDDEDALKLLLECEFDIPEALRRHGNRMIRKDKPNSVLNNWKEEEAASFEKGYAIYGKNFFQIMENKLPHRSVAEIVEFYYVWKKTQRCEEFLKCCGCEQKKFLLEPGLTDYMDCFVLEEDNLTANYCLQGGFPGMSMVSTSSPHHHISRNTPASSVNRSTDKNDLNHSSTNGTTKSAGEQTRTAITVPEDYTNNCGEDVKDLLLSLGTLQRPVHTNNGSEHHSNNQQSSSSSSHPLAHLSKPSTKPLGSNVTADDYPMICGGKVRGTWSLTHSSVTVQDLQRELEATGTCQAGGSRGGGKSIITTSSIHPHIVNENPNESNGEVLLTESEKDIVNVS